MMVSRCRTLVIFLFLFAFLLTFSSCGASSSDPEPGKDPEAGSEVPDMYGYNFSILSYNRGGVCQFAPVPNENTMGDALLAHYDYIEDLLNITITVKDAASKQVDILTKAGVTGQKSYDMADMFLSEAISLYKSGYLYVLNDLFDDEELFSGKYGTRNQLEAASHKRADGTDYWGFLCANWGIPYPSFQSALYFNPQLLQAFNQPNPHEMLEQKTWVWSSFQKICEALIGPGEDPVSKTDDTFGIPNDPNLRFVPRAALTSNGVRIVYYNGEIGKYETDIESPAAVEALEFCHSLAESGAMQVLSGNTGNDLVGNAVYSFMTGRAGFLCEYTYHGLVDKTSFSYADGFEFEWTTFPWGPNGTYGKMNATMSSADHFTYLPAGVGDYEVQQILPYLLTTFHDCDENEWKESLINRCFFSQKSADLFFEMYDSAVFDYFDAQGDFLTGDYTNQVISGKLTPAEAIKTALDGVKISIDMNRNDLMLTSLE